MKIIKKLKRLIGFKEWCGLPGLHIPAIKVKIDTGAKTSALYAFDIEPFKRHGEDYVHFKIHPIQGNKKIVIQCTAPIIDYRYITSSTGQKEKRYVIKTIIQFATNQWEIELTLADRTGMTFRMLLGREAIKKGNFIIDPTKSYLLGKMDKNHIKSFYST